MIECDQCGHPYDGTAYRWLCPRCKFKGNCCEGAPLALCSPPRLHDIASGDGLVNEDQAGVETRPQGI